MKWQWRSGWVLIATMGLACSGCGSGSHESAHAHPAQSTEHAHPTEGPHGGHLVEIGNEDYHAEVSHDEDARSLTIYILDRSAKNPVAIDSQELTINLSDGGKAEQYKVSALPDSGDPSGRSSRFVSSDPELGKNLDTEGNNAQLVVEIAGTQYRGAMKHEHRR